MSAENNEFIVCIKKLAKSIIGYFKQLQVEENARILALQKANYVSNLESNLILIRKKLFKGMWACNEYSDFSLNNDYHSIKYSNLDINQGIVTFTVAKYNSEKKYHIAICIDMTKQLNMELLQIASNSYNELCDMNEYLRNQQDMQLVYRLKNEVYNKEFYNLIKFRVVSIIDCGRYFNVVIENIDYSMLNNL